METTQKEWLELVKQHTEIHSKISTKLAEIITIAEKYGFDLDGSSDEFYIDNDEIIYPYSDYKSEISGNRYIPIKYLYQDNDKYFKDKKEVREKEGRQIQQQLTEKEKQKRYEQYLELKKEFPD